MAVTYISSLSFDARIKIKSYSLPRFFNSCLQVEIFKFKVSEVGSSVQAYKMTSLWHPMPFKFARLLKFGIFPMRNVYFFKLFCKSQIELYLKVAHLIWLGASNFSYKKSKEILSIQSQSLPGTVPFSTPPRFESFKGPSIGNFLMK